MDFVFSNKLVRHLEKLTKKEMTRFRAFVFSPYHNKHREVQLLVDYLAEIYPHFDEKHCNRERIYLVVFGAASSFSEKKLAPVITYTQRLLEEFWALELFRDNKRQQHHNLLQKLRFNKLFPAYERAYEEALEEGLEQPLRDSQFYAWRFQLATERENYYSQIDQHDDYANLIDKQNYLDYFYFAEKLRDACDNMVQGQLLKVEYTPSLLEAILAEIAANPAKYAEVPAVMAYYQVYLMLQLEEPAQFQVARATLQRWEKALSREEQIVLYNYLMNYCIAKINQGNHDFFSEIFALYRFQLEQGLLLKAGRLSEWDYKNIVTTGIRLDQLDWVRQFIETYKSFLPPDVVENAYIFNLATYHYAAKNYDAVLNLLHKVEYSDKRYNWGAKTLLLRTYYELNEYETLFSLTESFRQYLLRNKLMADIRRQGYYNLFKLTRRAAYLRHRLGYLSSERALLELDKIKKSMTKGGTIFNRSWLEEKIQDLEREIRREPASGSLAG